MTVKVVQTHTQWQEAVEVTCHECGYPLRTLEGPFCDRCLDASDALKEVPWQWHFDGAPWECRPFWTRGAPEADYADGAILRSRLIVPLERT